MIYKTLNYADLTDPNQNCFLAEILFNGQSSSGFLRANSIEGWVETIVLAMTFHPTNDAIKDQNNNPILSKIYGNVEIYEINKQGERIILQGE